MPVSGNDKAGIRATAECLADILGNLIANVLSTGGAVAAGAAGVAATGTALTATAAAGPAVGMLAIFLGVRHWLVSRDTKKSAQFEAWLQKTLADQTAASDRQSAQDVIRDFDAQLDYKRLEKRLRFLRAAMRTVQEHQQNTTARLAPLADEIETLHEDQQVEFHVLERILRDHHDDLRDTLAGVSGRIDDLTRWLRLVPSLRIPRRPYDPHSPTGALHYSTRGVAFQGRQDELAALRAFLAERDPQDTRRQRAFCWLLVCGPGGAGKSRAALELCLEFEPAWRVGFLAEDALEPFDPHLWNNWQPDEPTLIVVDYVARYPAAVGSILRILKHKSLPHPVRLLLLERDAPSGWAETSWGRDLLGSGGDALDADETASTAMGRDDRGHRLPLSIGRLADEQLWAVICDLLAQLGAPQPSRADALRLLTEVDDEARPLFAVMLAHFLAEKPDAAGGSFSRQTLLTFILERERQRWARLHLDQPEYLNLLCLATLCGGLRRSAQNDPLAHAALAGFVPAPAQFEAKIYAQLSEADARRELSPLEPDILGEFFVLDYLEKQDAVHTQRLVDAAWTLRPYDEDAGRGVVLVVLRTVRDFWAVAARRGQVDALWKQRPTDERGRTVWAGMLMELCGVLGEGALIELREAARADDRPPIREELAKGLTNAVAHLGSAGQVDAALERLSELRELRQADDRPPIREELAKGLTNAVAHLGSAGQVDAALERLAELRALRQADDRPPIREALAKGLYNVLTDLGRAGQVDAVLERLAELRELRQADDRPPIREQLANGLCNALTDLGRVGQVDAALERLAELRELRQADDRPPIREALAMGLYNVLTALGRAGQADAALERLAELRELRQADDRPPIRERLAKGLANAVAGLCLAKRVDEAEALLAELLALAGDDGSQAAAFALGRAHLAVGVAKRKAGQTQDADDHAMYARSLARQCPPLAEFLQTHFPGLAPPAT